MERLDFFDVIRMLCGVIRPFYRSRNHEKHNFVRLEAGIFPETILEPSRITQDTILRLNGPQNRQNWIEKRVFIISPVQLARPNEDMIRAFLAGAEAYFV